MLTQPFVSTKVSQFILWTLRQEMRFRTWLQHLMLHFAVIQAFRKFVLHHPRWAASLFDEYFLMGKAAPLLDRYLQTAILPTADELATAWADQLGPMAPSRYSPGRIEVQLAAADFLSFLAAELRKYQISSAQRPHGATL